ncbi:MAG: cob(I)yrinic acid a,c-diamide adenosyltransferase [Pedobacter sp.]|nr:MAG: cob(I)yrinic acid a,c-diamide adenosyltransferase [Pedobacter sp.]
MKIYTKTGDTGLTSLIGGKRVFKHDKRIEAYGTVDELNSYIGLIACLDVTDEDRRLLKEIQDRLFTIGSSLACDSETSKVKIPEINSADITLLETEIDEISVYLPELKSFILPGGSSISSNCHIARCICRRAERNVVELAENGFVNENVVKYLNRLSDYLFILARKVNFKSGIEESAWIPRL